MWIGDPDDGKDAESRSCLKVREGQYIKGDDNEEACPHRGVYTENNFTHIDHHVEKSVVDLFGESETESNTSNVYFFGSLDKLNVLFVKNSWAYAHENVLKLPEAIRSE